MMEAMMNRVRQEAARLFAQFMPPRVGIVSSYDPGKYACKVLLQPENIETGWLPITTQWVGNGWGMTCPPSKGDVVEVQFQESDRGGGFVVGRFYSNLTPPPGPCPSGEFWLVHQTGTFMKFHNDGTIEMNAAEINMTAPQVNITGDVFITGELMTTKDITADGDIYDHNATKSSLDNVRTVYNTHTHPEGVGVTDVPNQQLP